MRYPLVLITWKDHTAAQNEWVSTEHLDDHSGLGICFSAGWLLKETADSYIVCSVHDDEGEELGGIWTIGKGMVVSKEILREGKDGREQAD